MLEKMHCFHIALQTSCKFVSGSATSLEIWGSVFTKNVIDSIFLFIFKCYSSFFVSWFSFYLIFLVYCNWCNVIFKFIIIHNSLHKVARIHDVRTYCSFLGKACDDLLSVLNFTRFRTLVFERGLLVIQETGWSAAVRGLLSVERVL